jgi:hypothetical protein
MLLWLLPLLLAVPLLRAAEKDQDKSKSEKSSPAADEFQRLLEEVKKATQEVRKAYGEAKTDADREKIQEQFRKRFRDEYASRFIQLAEKDPKSDTALQALTVVIANVAETEPPFTKAKELLLKDHVNSQKLMDICQALAQRGMAAAAEQILRGVIEKSTDHDVQGQAHFGLGTVFKSKSESPELKRAEAEKLNQQAEDEFAKVVDKFGDVKAVAEQAKADLTEVRRLGIGKQAPDIAGEDADGKKFKLSDYRGKVVVVDFWGTH